MRKERNFVKILLLMLIVVFSLSACSSGSEKENSSSSNRDSSSNSVTDKPLSEKPNTETPDKEDIKNVVTAEPYDQKEDEIPTSEITPIVTEIEKKAEGKEAFKLNSDMIPGFYDADGYRFFTFDDYDEGLYIEVGTIRGEKLKYCEWRGRRIFWDYWCDIFNLWEDEKWHEHLNLLYNLGIKSGIEDKEVMRDAEKKIANWYEGLHDVTVVFPRCLEAMFDCFKGEKSISKIYLPDGLKIIGDSAFADCINLEYAYIPDSVIEIDKKSFKNCSKLDAETKDKIQWLQK